jgi:predicted RNase H-like nuclease (RuvC/YqgF family)
MSDRVLFVSGRCEHCKKILIGIQQHSFLKPLFRVINVDTQPYPNYVKSVPSILINSQVISGQTVFEYFGKLVEGKKAQEQRVQNNQTNESDQGQCRINEEGELEGYCGGGLGGSGIEFSMISEENDDYTKRTYKMENSYDFLEGASDDIHSQVKSMEAQDSQLSEKRKSFDNDLERMQRERGELMGQQSGPGGQRPPMNGGQGPGMGQGMGMMR